MTGLEKILKAIDDQAQTGADTIIDEANKAAEEILKAAKLEAEKKCVQIAEKSNSDLQGTISRAESAATLQEKKILLEAKQQIISNMIMKARNSLENLADSEFIEIILQMVKKYAHNKKGNIVFTAKDKNRLPNDFEDKMKVVLSDKPEAVLTVSEVTVNIDGGFLLKYGDVEENCSFDAIFSAAKESLQDKVNTLLFEQ